MPPDNMMWHPGKAVIDLSTIGPLRVRLVEVLGNERFGHSIDVLLRASGHSPDPQLPTSQRSPNRWAMRPVLTSQYQFPGPRYGDLLKTPVSGSYVGRLLTNISLSID